MIPSNGGQRQRGPIYGGNVFAGNGSPLGVVGLMRIRVRPGAAEVFELREYIVKTAEPVRQQKKDVDQVGDPPKVRINGATLNHVVESITAVYLDESGESVTPIESSSDNDNNGKNYAKKRVHNYITLALF